MPADLSLLFRDGRQVAWLEVACRLCSARSYLLVSAIAYNRITGGEKHPPVSVCRSCVEAAPSLVPSHWPPLPRPVLQV